MKLKPKLVLAFLLTALIVVIAGTIWFSQKQAPLVKITYAVGSGLHRAPVYIAIEKGYFKKEGLDVKLQEYNTGKEALNAVIKGEFFMETFLISHRILRDEVEVVNLNPKEMFDALTEGKIDAVSTWNPHVLRLQKELGVKGITFYGEGIYTETFNISAMQYFVHKNPETVKRVLSSLIRAVEFIRENPDKSRRIISNYIRMDEAMTGELWDIYHFRVTLDQSLLITLEGQARWAIKNKLTNKTKVPNYLDFIYQDAL